MAAPATCAKSALISRLISAIICVAMAKFPMRIDPVWRPALLPFGGTPDSSYAEVTADGVHFRFGFLFDRTILRSEIATAYRWQPAWWHGIGWRSNLTGRIGLLGSHQGVVEIRLKNRTRSWGVFPCDRIAISLQDPEGFLEALDVPAA